MSSALITRREYSNLFRSEKTGWLLGNINDVIACEIDFEVLISTASSSTNPFTAENVGGSLRIERTTGSFFDEGFSAGATVTITESFSGTPETFTGTISVANQTLLIITPVSGSITDGTYPYTNGVDTNTAMSIVSTGLVDGVELNYNFIKNSQLSANTLQSLIDNTTPFFQKSGIDATVLTYVDLNQVGYKSGASFLSAEIKGRGITGSGVQQFTIKLVYIVPPIGTLQDFLTNTIPEPFYDIECVTDIFKIKMLPQFNNPNISISTDSSSSQLFGNTGWFNENYNGLTNNYSIVNVELLNSLGLPVSGIQIDEETTFNITVNQPGNSGTSKYKFGFMWVPNDTSLYQVTPYQNYENLLYNGLSDSAAFTFSTAPGSFTGKTNASGAQMDIEIVSMSANGDDVTLQGKFKPNAAFATYFDSLTDDDRKYILWLSLADETLATSLSDRVSLLLQFSQLVAPTSSFQQYDIDNSFLNHAQPRSQKGADLYEGASEDEVVASTIVRVDTSNNDIIEEVKFIIEGYNISTGEIYRAETRTYNTAGFPILSGVQQILINDLRGFDMAAGVEKNEILLERDPTGDVGTKKAYRFFYPFRLRWEDWILNSNVPGAFYNVGELLNGLNQNWAPKDNFGNWRISYAVQMKVNRNGTIINTKNRFQFLQRTYEESAIYTAEITHYTADGLTSLYTGLNADGIRTNAILPSANTLFKALITLSDPMGDVGDITKFFAVMRIEEYRGPGETNIMMLSSVLVNETANNILFPLTGETGPKITKVSDTEILLECYIDYTKLNPTKFQYKTSARIGCKGLHAGKYSAHYAKQYD